MHTTHGPMVGYCWSTVCDGGPTLKHHWVIALLGALFEDLRGAPLGPTHQIHCWRVLQVIPPPTTTVKSREHRLAQPSSLLHLHLHRQFDFAGLCRIEAAMRCLSPDTQTTYLYLLLRSFLKVENVRAQGE